MAVGIARAAAPDVQNRTLFIDHRRNYPAIARHPPQSFRGDVRPVFERRSQPSLGRGEIAIDMDHHLAPVRCGRAGAGFFSCESGRSHVNDGIRR